MNNLVMNGEDVVANYARKEETDKVKIQFKMDSPGYCLLQDYGSTTKVFGFTRPEYIDEIRGLPDGIEWVTDPIELAKCKTHFETDHHGTIKNEHSVTDSLNKMKNKLISKGIVK